jgi:hypothetical protein
LFSLSNNNSNLHTLSGGKGIGILVSKCGLCNNLREGVEYSIKEVNDSPVMSLDDLLYQIKLDKQHNQGKLKITFNKFSMQCMTHKEMMPGSTSIEFSDEDLEILNNTPISKIYLAIDQ